MFQTGGLIVFCGLLALPLPLSLALPEDLVPGPTDLAGQLTGALSDGLVSGGLLDTIKNLPLSDILKAKGDTSKGLIGKLLQQTINPLSDLTGIEITNPKLLKIGLARSEDSHRFFLNIPIGFNLKLRVPIVNQHLLTLAVKLNATLEALFKKDENESHLVVGDCSQAPVNTEVLLLDGNQAFLIQSLVNRFIDTFKKDIPKVVLNEVCSTVNELLSQFDVSLVQSILDELVPVKDIAINI